jgi:DNA-binding transcriptional regulator YdaS (Cro superfamily)
VIAQKMEGIRVQTRVRELRMSNNSGPARGWEQEFQDRLDICINELGGVPKTAALVGVKHDQVYRWRSGATKMPLYAGKEICRATGRSLDWLTGLRDSVGYSDDELERAISDAVPFALRMAPYFGEQSPEQIGMAAAKRALMVLRGEVDAADQESA